jgi:hypothetical protein
MADLLPGRAPDRSIGRDDPNALAVPVLRGEPFEHVVRVRGVTHLQRAEPRTLSGPVEDDHAVRALQRDEAGEHVHQLALAIELPRVKDVVAVEEVEHPPVRMPALDPETLYLAELVWSLRGVLGDELVGVYAGGSYALGDYERARSDLDVSAITHSRTGPLQGAEVVKAVRHEALPCPARGLELVLYPLETARSANVQPGFDLNLNTGRGMAFRADFVPVEGERHWFAIDKSVLAEHGITLLGPPASTVFRPASRERLLPVLAEALRWCLREPSPGDAAVATACRALRYSREGVWSSKQAAVDWAREQAMEIDVAQDFLETAITELETR